MKPGFSAIGYRFCLKELYARVHRTAQASPWKGRALALPLALLLLITIPLAKVAVFLEALTFTLANLFAPFFPKYCSFYDAWVSLKRSLVYFIGAIFSPISALFAACAVFVSVLNDPVAASKKFAESCKD